MKKIVLIVLALFMGVAAMAQSPKHYCLLKGKVKTIVENKEIHYTFNEAGAVTKVEMGEMGKRRLIACEYNDKGQLVKRTGAVTYQENYLLALYENVEEAFEETFTYANGQLIKSYNKLNWNKKYNYTTRQYDKVKLNGETVKYTYNPKGQLTWKTTTLDDGTRGRAKEYKYNAKGLVIADGGESFKYNAQNLLSHIQGYDYSYTYEYNDKKDVIQEHEEGIGIDVTLNFTYEYDSQNNWIKRVTASSYDIPDVTTTREITYY